MRNNRNRMYCYFALPVLLLAACVLQSSFASAQITSLGVDCAKINVSQLLMEDNLGAGRTLIECGYAPGGQPAGRGVKSPAPPNIRVSNRACSPGSCTKSESMVSASTKNPKNLVVQYNDDNTSAGTLAGTSYSNDGGVTFHEIQPPPLANGHGFNIGDPIVIFNSKLNKWFAGDLALGCGGQGIGMWTSPDGKTWTTGACAHNGSGDDRESLWVDNEPTSGKYGRMYISFNDFNNNGGALSLVYSDNGTTWTGPVILNSGFIRDVQVTGSPRGAARFEGKNSTVFVAAMDEGGGGLNTRQNIIYKSLDGGATWSAITMGARFNPPGDRTCTEYNPYFAVVNPIWRHMGWGEPAVGPKGVVHYVFAGKGTGNDTGDIFYTRSINNGKTWSKAVKLNTDPDGSFKTQWMPSLSATSDGEITASWYDRRKATSACNSVGDPGCKYERVGRQSKTNGASFLAEVTISSKIIPEPAQGDSGIVPCYAGDYDYNTALNKSDSGTATGVAYVTWTDGRRVVSGTNVQDVDFAKVPEP